MEDYNGKIQAIIAMRPSIHDTNKMNDQRFKRFQATQSLKVNELEAIAHLVESHSMGLRFRATLRYEKTLAAPDGEKCDQSKLSISKDYVGFTCSKLNVGALMEMIESMPKEWTIIQLTPQPSGNFSPYSQAHKTQSLYLTLFHCGKNQPKPVCVAVDAPKCTVNGQKIELLEEAHDIQRLNKEVLTVNPSKVFTGLDKITYFDKRKSIDDRLTSLVTSLQSLYLKHWRCLFLGKYVQKVVQKNIEQHLQEFFDNHKLKFDDLDERTRVFILQLVKASPHLSMKELSAGVKSIFEETKGKDFVIKLINHIRLICTVLSLEKEKKYPVILIIDDTLDPLPWEMIDVFSSQSASRVPSLHIAYALFREHETSIKNGFKIIKDSNNGTYIMNPDCNLLNMSKRMKMFHDYWLPNWKGLNSVKPTEDQFGDIVCSGEIFAYYGHGNGTQFIGNERIQKLKVKSVVLLFGCGSGRLTLPGPNLEMFGTDQMYLIACCPCVVGMLWEITDHEADLFSTEFLSAWIPNENNVHWKHVNKDMWRDYKLSWKQYNNVDNPNEPELLEALGATKRSKALKHFITTAAVIARGIPVKIES